MPNGDNPGGWEPWRGPPHGREPWWGSLSAALPLGHGPPSSPRPQQIYSALRGIQPSFQVLVTFYRSVLYSVRDPPDPHVFEPPGSGSISKRYGSGSGTGSFYQQAKIVRKPLIPTVLWLRLDFLSLKNDVNAPSKSNKQKSFFLLASWRSMTKISRIRIQDPDPEPNPDPLVRGMDPRIRIRIYSKISWIRIPEHCFTTLLDWSMSWSGNAKGLRWKE